MVVAFIGNILDISIDGTKIEDKISKEVHLVKLTGDQSLELKIGDTGIFVGELYNSKFRVTRYEIRKFLDPMYEEDLFSVAGKYSLIPPINDPFTEVYERFLEQDKEETKSREENGITIYEIWKDGLKIREFQEDQ
jgi:hypothetical protein